MVTPILAATAKRGCVRWGIACLLALGFGINYCDRSVMVMVMPAMSRDLHLGPAEVGLLLGTFFWSYSLCVVPVGYLVDRFGVRLMLPLAFAAWSLITSATGLAGSFPALLAARIGLGAAESPVSPATVKVVSQWFPRRERAFATSIWGVGSRLGAMVALPVSALLTVHLGWRWTFIVVGAIGLLWLPCWLKSYRLPRDHRTVTAEELHYIEAGKGAIERIEDATGQLPWAALLRYRTIWGLMIGSYSASYSNAFFLTWLPSYLVLTRHFSLRVRPKTSRGITEFSEHEADGGEA